MYNKVFWMDAFERMVSTGAQTALLAFGGQAAELVVSGLKIIVFAFVGGMILALLKSLAALTIGSRGSASFVVGATETNQLKG